MEKELTGQVAIVTGSASGIGQTLATTLAKAGANVVLVDIADLNASREKCAAEGVEVLPFQGSVTSEADIERMARETLARFGRIDILVNNAGGVTGLGVTLRPLEDFPSEDWSRVVDLNLNGPFLATKAVVATMKKQRSGRIVFISSGAARSTSRTHIYPYTSAKAGVLGLMREVAWHMGKYGVTANAICPGMILASDRLKKHWADWGEENQREWFAKVAMGRTGEPEEIADVVLMLCSDRTRYMTGQTLSVDGGHWMI